MTDQPLCVGITGASGFVGGAIARALVVAGYRVVSLGRRPAQGYEHRHYELSAPIPPGLLVGLDAVVHAAYDLSLTNAAAIAATNVRGTKLLASAADASRVRLILVSSMSAYDGTRQLYGQAKLRSEADVLAAGGDAVRVGLVWGGDEGGMIGTLKRLSRLPVVPVLGWHPHQFTVHADDMALGFTRLVEAPSLGDPVGLAHPEPVRLERILAYLAGGSRPLFVPIPWRPVYGAMRVAERARVRLPVRADSLLGVVEPAATVPGSSYWSSLGIALTPFPAADAARDPPDR